MFQDFKIFEPIKDAIKHLVDYEYALLFFFGLLYLLRLIYLIVFSGRLLCKKNYVSGGKSPLSLILTFRNEEENIRKNLPVVLNIDNVEFEVVAVDDFSSDNSMIILGTLREKYNKLHISALNQETWFSVKMAQNISIKAAKHEWVMVIPPSIVEFHTDWLPVISQHTSENTDVVVNYSNVKHDGTIYNLLYRAEYFFQQLKSFSFILNGLPYIVSEDNVAFKKEKYFLAGGYRKKIMEPYANLELLINSFIKRRKTKVIFSDKTSILKSEKVKKAGFFDLLKKEAHIRKYMPFSRRIFFSCEEWTSCVFIFITALSLFIIPELWPVFLTLLILLAFVRVVIIKKAISRLNESKLLLSSLIYAVFLPCLKRFFISYYNYYSRKRCKSKK